MCVTTVGRLSPRVTRERDKKAGERRRRRRLARARVARGRRRGRTGLKALTAEFNAKLIKSQLSLGREKEHRAANSTLLRLLSVVASLLLRVRLYLATCVHPPAFFQASTTL